MAQDALEARLQQNLNSGTLRLDAAGAKPASQLSGRLAVGGLDFAVTGKLLGPETWEITPASPVTAGIGLTSLIPLVSDPAILHFLPAGEEQLNGLSLSQLTLALGAGAAQSADLAYTLQSTGDWDVIPGKLVIRNFGISVRATRNLRPAAQGADLSPPQTSFGGQIFGTARIGSYDLAVAFGMDGGAIWSVEAGTEKNPLLPSLADLAAFMGIDDQSAGLTQGLESFGLHDFTLTGIRIAFNRFTRSLSHVEVSGSVVVDGVKLILSTRVPDFYISGGLAKGNQIALASLLPGDVALPAGFPQVTFSELQISLAVRKPAFGFGGTGETHWEVVPGLLVLEKVRAHLNVSRAGGKVSLTGGAGGMLTIADALVELYADLGDNLTLGGGVTELSLSTLFEKLAPGVALPPELPELVFDLFTFNVTPATGEVSVNGRCTIAWDLPFGVSGLAVNTVDFSFHRGPATTANGKTTPGAASCSLRLTGAGPVTVVEGLVFKNLSLDFELVNQSDWTLSGSIAASVFDGDYTLAASLEETPALRKISLTAGATSALVNLDGVGTLDGKAVAIHIAKALQPAGATTGATSPAGAANTTASSDTSVALSNTSPYTWDVAVTGGLKIENAFDLEGTLQLYRKADSIGFAFKPQVAEAVIPIPIPQQPVQAHLGLGYIEVVRSTDAKGQMAWAFDATVNLGFTGLPHALQRLIADQIAAHFKADTTGAALSVDRIIQPTEIPIPDVRIGRFDLQLGTALLDASNFMVRFAKAGASSSSTSNALALSMDFGFGLPEHLNDNFGGRGHAQPFFNTYVRGKSDTVTRLRLSIGSADGMQIQWVTSPIAAIHLIVEGQDTWYRVTLGDFADLKLMLPDIKYDGNSFSARMGFKQMDPVNRPLKVPLAPLKGLLRASHLEAASDALPDGLPLKEIKIFDDRNELNTGALLDSLGHLKGFETVRSDVEKALDLIKDRVDRLPDRFKYYLDIDVPDSFECRVSVDNEGGVRGTIKVDGGDPDQPVPIKLLYPMMGMIGPKLAGIEIYSVTAGDLIAGSLLLLDVDVRVDQFDLLTLAAALALPLDKLPILPDTRDLSQRFIVKNLFMPVIYETVIPIPVPLFYDELGVEYLGIEGLKFQLHWSFPRPQLDAGDAARLFSDFRRFFTDHDFLLDARKPPRNMDLKLTIGPHDIQLPKYLGGKSLGSETATTVISAYESLAHLLNGLKTLSLDELIQAVPLDYRIGREQVSFGCMNLEADWMFTTPKEFQQSDYRWLNFRDSEVGKILSVLPASPGTKDQGLVIFLRGDWKATNFARLDACFGLLGTSAGFGTGVRVAGGINDLLDIELQGTVVIDPKARDVFSLAGHSSLSILNDQVFKGDLSMTENRFDISGSLDLFPNSPLRITGRLAGHLSDQELYIYGAASVTLDNYFTLAGATAELTHSAVKVTGTWMNQTVTFAAEKGNGSLQLRATLSKLVIGDVLRLTDTSGNYGPTAVLGVGGGRVANLYLDGAVTVLGIGAHTTVIYSPAGFSFTAGGNIFGQFKATLTAGGRDLLDGGAISVTATMENDFFSFLNDNTATFIKQASDRFNGTLDSAQQDVKKAQAKVDGLDQQISARRQTVQAAFDDAQRSIQGAEQKVEDARRSVNSYQGEIDSNNNQISSLEDDIKSHWWRAVDEGAKITALEAENVTLKGYRETAEGALSAAEAALDLARKGAHVVPPESDPELASLISARAIAQQSLDGFNKTLEGLKDANRTLSSVGDYIARQGLSALVDVKAASFQGSLDSVKGGSVSLSVDLEFMKNAQHFELDFNFHSPLDGCQKLAQLLIR